jgi:hypothetical protein
MYTASATNPKLLYITQSPNPPNTVLHRSHNETVKLVTGGPPKKLRVKAVHGGKKVANHCVK